MANLERVRPLTCGAGITSSSGRAGTLGCFVKTSNGSVALVTTGEIIGREPLAPEQSVYQPSADADSVNRIASVEKITSLHDGNENRFDIGYADLADR